MTIIEDALENRSRVDCEIHAEHHRFISEWIDTMKRRRERCEAIKQQVYG